MLKLVSSTSNAIMSEGSGWPVTASGTFAGGSGSLDEGSELSGAGSGLLKAASECSAEGSQCLDGGSELSGAGSALLRAASECSAGGSECFAARRLGIKWLVLDVIRL